MNTEFWAGIFVLSGIAVGVGVYHCCCGNNGCRVRPVQTETNNMSGIGVGTQVHGWI